MTPVITVGIDISIEDVEPGHELTADSVTNLVELVIDSLDEQGALVPSVSTSGVGSSVRVHIEVDVATAEPLRALSVAVQQVETALRSTGLRGAGDGAQTSARVLTHA